MKKTIGDCPRSIYMGIASASGGSILTPLPIFFHDGSYVTFHDGSHVMFHGYVGPDSGKGKYQQVPRTSYAGEVEVF